MAPRPSRASGAALAGVVLTALALVVFVGGSSASLGASSSQPAAVRVTHAYPVTLVTGDRLVLNALSNGKQSVTVANSASSSSIAELSTSFHAVRQNGDIYVWPVDYGPYIGTLLDRELFNVSKLVRQGYSDKASSTTPLIVDYRGSASTQTALPADVTKTRTLSSIHAVAARQAKAHAKAFGHALKQQLATDAPAIEQGERQAIAQDGPFAGIRKIYLDQKVKPALADSVPQIGAP
jgi:hypothetical protein